MNITLNPTTGERTNTTLPSQDALTKHLEIFLYNQKLFVDNCPHIIRLQLRHLNRDCTMKDFVSSLTANQVYLLLEIFDNFATLKETL